MRKLQNCVDCEQIQGFPLARFGAFSYNPVDFCSLRESPAGIAAANLKGQPAAKAIIQEAVK